MLEELTKKGFTIFPLHHAEAILTHDMEVTIKELSAALSMVRIPTEELVRGGGGESDATQRLRAALATLGWNKHQFVVEKKIDGVTTEVVSHEVDHVRRIPTRLEPTKFHTFALEIEWNNKDPFFDRDLENFKRLHAEGAISVGGIITRGRSLHESLRAKIAAFARKAKIKRVEDLAQFYTPTPRQKLIYQKKAVAFKSFEEGWADAFVSDKFGEATTHWRKLEERVTRGVGNPCPLVLIGLPDTVVTP